MCQFRKQSKIPHNKCNLERKNIEKKVFYIIKYKIICFLFFYLLIYIIIPLTSYFIF